MIGFGRTLVAARLVVGDADREGGDGKPVKGAVVRHSSFHYSVLSSSTRRKHALVRSSDS